MLLVVSMSEVGVVLPRWRSALLRVLVVDV